MANPNPVGTSDFLVRLRADIAARIAEIAPRIDEHTTLRAALTSIDEATTAAPRAAYGARQPQVLEALRSQPGSKPRAIADALGLDPTRVYAPLRALKQRGAAHQRGGRWYAGPAAEAPGPSAARARAAAEPHTPAQPA